MIEARKERVSELIRSLESVQVRSQALGKEESTREGSSSSWTETGAGKNDAAHSRREASDDIQSATDQMRVAVGDDSMSEPKAAPKPPQSLPACQLTPRRSSWNAGEEPRLEWHAPAPRAAGD